MGPELFVFAGVGMVIGIINDQFPIDDPTRRPDYFVDPDSQYSVMNQPARYRR